MRWLITVRKSSDLERLARVIRACGGERETDGEPIPLGESEIVIHAHGPAELPDLLKSDSDVLDVYPDSEMQAY